ncbi:hypothetical protein Bca52824_075073 [Brassica carinata]|uniref:Uncharacterized protein n=1 Tax=Brassica carinata TaxID=52824 RepID=A0A8X7TW18_BRACI|nr:hypothetical protein Bca52824_075073 [Brassica carinata]
MEAHTEDSMEEAHTEQDAHTKQEAHTEQDAHTEQEEDEAHTSESSAVIFPEIGSQGHAPGRMQCQS